MNLRHAPPLFDEVEADGDLRTVDGLHALMAVKGLGPRKALRLAGRIGSSERLSHLAQDDLAALIGQDAMANLIAAPLEITPLAVPPDGAVIGYFDAAYPPMLRRIADPPPILWTRGLVPTLAAVAVVGTRKPTDWSIRTAVLVAEAAVGRGFSVVSGLALGTDTTAHKASLAAGGTTIAVLGSGVDSPSPAANRGLADQIVEAGGCLIAEVPPGTKPSSRTLVARDRLQSGLSLATFVIQSGIPGGTMHTARFTIEQDRLLVVAIPTRPTRPTIGPDPYAGNLALTNPAGCDPAVLRADGPLAAKIAAKRPVADLTVSKEEDLGPVWKRVDDLRMDFVDRHPS